MNCMATATALAALDAAIANGSTDASVAALRAINAAPDHARRLAMDKLDAHLRDNPEKPAKPVVDLMISLRRVGGVA